MNHEKLKHAVKEAKEFIRRAELASKEHQGSGYMWGSKLTSSVRRQSMELTRALTEVRKAN